LTGRIHRMLFGDDGHAQAHDPLHPPHETKE
jgi:hypothetical protein